MKNCRPSSRSLPPSFVRACLLYARNLHSGGEAEGGNKCKQKGKPSQKREHRVTKYLFICILSLCVLLLLEGESSNVSRNMSLQRPKCLAHHSIVACLKDKPEKHTSNASDSCEKSVQYENLFLSGLVLGLLF